MFIDYAEVELQSGNGGAGAISFRREKFVPKGGPDGGNGGMGGSIIFCVDHNLHTLQDIKYKRIYKAQNGKQGSSNRKTGKDGEDIFITVPLGTLIKSAKTKDILADLIQNEETYTATEGGKGGKGNINFKSSTNQTPRYAQPGLPGTKGVFILELKVLADVGLVGLPNAGKSTLLSRISAATPKIANYPFTTLKPNLGIVKYGEFQSFVMADIPGLIEGASTGKGLGLQFLRHIERTNVLLFLIDVMEENPEKVFNTLKNEVYNFNKDLKEKKSIIVRTKTDLIQLSESQNLNWISFPESYYDISSVSGSGLKILIKAIVEIIHGT